MMQVRAKGLHQRFGFFSGQKKVFSGRWSAFSLVNSASAGRWGSRKDWYWYLRKDFGATIKLAHPRTSEKTVFSIKVTCGPTTDTNH
jgi:hypothetical protein